jgi:hypothetical protein
VDEALVRRGLLAPEQVRTYEAEALVLGDEVLIGQTVLEKLDLLVDRERRRLVPPRTGSGWSSPGWRVRISWSFSVALTGRSRRMGLPDRWVGTNTMLTTTGMLRMV